MSKEDLSLLPRKPQARRIPLSRRSHITGFQSLATGIADHESALERDFVTLTSFLDPSAIIVSQPVTIRFFQDSVLRRYTPDFLVRHSSRSELIEVKYEKELRERASVFAPAFEAAARWAEEHQATFSVRTESDIRGVVLANAKRLLPLRGLPLDTKMAMLALTRAHAMHRPTFGGILFALPNRHLALATLWRLIARDALRVDLTRLITLDSEVSLP